MRIEQKLCKENFFSIQYMSNAITCINKRFAVNNSCIYCMILVFNLSNPRIKILHAKTWFKVAKYDESYTVCFCTWIRTQGLMVKASHNELGDMGSNPAGF